MGLTIIYSHIAKRDLQDIYLFIKRNSPYYAKKEIQNIRLSIKKLRLNPLIGKIFEEAEDELTRELIYKNYKIIYDLDPNERIVILSIHHHARSLSNNPSFNIDD